MNKKLLYGLLAVLLLITGIVVYKAATSGSPAAIVTEEPAESLPSVASTVSVTVGKSRGKDNTVVLEVMGLGGTYASVAYELTYESQGLIKGVNSGSKPIEVGGQDGFSREVYLGTCSRNVCKPDAGVKAVSVVLEFTDSSGKKSQFSSDFDL